MKIVLLFLAIFALIFVSADVGYKVVSPTGYTVLGKSLKSTLYSVDLPAGHYEDPILLIDLHGSRHDMGFAYGALLGKRMVDNYYTFFSSLLGNSLWDRIVRQIIELALDWQYSSYLSVQLPEEYKEEIRSIGEGAQSVGLSSIEAQHMITRMITLANAPGDLEDFVYILLREFKESYPQYSDIIDWIFKYFFGDRMANLTGLQCSMFAVWGNRTENGLLFSARNLDWNSDTGIAKNKLVTVYHPEGKIAHATLGFIGLHGALTGMSEKGLTVHEANLESNKITFSGFPWLLRLRYVMENAHNIAQAKSIWENTNNTVGFNHMVSSASDVFTGHPALVQETMFNYTAYFLDNDAREAAATYTDKNNVTTKIGFPLKEAVWRTNHGYDPTIRENFMWSQAPTTWSMRRYMMIHDSFTYYEGAKIKIGELEAINITAIAGDKGSASPYQCQNNRNGSCVLSVTFNPGKLRMYSAWENGHKENWRPACCNTFVLFEDVFNMNKKSISK